MMKLLPAITLAAVSLVLSSAASAQPGPVVERLVGAWEGSGTLFGRDATFHMTWERVLGDRFLRLTFRNGMNTADGVQPVLEAQAFYKALDEARLEGTWFDTRGVVQPLRGEADATSLTVHWGSPETEAGRTVYRILGEDRIEVEDFVLKAGEWDRFGEATYHRARAAPGQASTRARSVPPDSAGGTAPGTVLWKHDVGAELWGPLTLAGGVLYLGCDDGRVFSFDLESRMVRWEFPTQGPVRSAVSLGAGKAVVASDDGYLYALDAIEGKELWRFDLGSRGMERILPAFGPPYEYDFLHSSPVIDGGTVYVGSMDGHLHAVDLESGGERWRFKTEGKVRATPVVDGETVYFGSWDGVLYALNTEDGTLRWQAATGGVIQGAAAVAEGVVVVGSRSAKTVALDASTGSVLWAHRHDDGSWVESTPVIADGVVYIGSSDALNLFAYDLATGDELWSFATGGWTWGAPALDREAVYIGAISASPYYMPGVTLEAGFHAVDRKSGRLRWSLHPEPIEGYITGGVFAPPVFRDQVLVVAALDGRLYALKP